jgi:hypothetical protein
MTITAHPTLIKLVWSGTLGATEDEIFSYSRWAAIETPEDLEGVMDIAANDVTDLLAESTTGGVTYSTLGQAFPDTVAWTLLKGYVYDEATGLNLSVDPAVRVLTDTGEATGVQTLTNQDALAVTTQAFPRGPSSYNRFYLPTMIANVQESPGLVRGATIDDIQTQLKFANTAHKAEATPNSWEYGVYSTALHTMREIDRYWTGNVMDTIRKRRNKLVETRHPLAG